jgi:hypothetical protein
VNNRLILSLCDHTGNWPKFYRDAGYSVRQVDLKSGEDVRLLPYLGYEVHGILCAPDCGPFAGSGAQYWSRKDADGTTLAGLALVDACLRAVAIYAPHWWALENPVGRLRRWLGPPRLIFDPCDYGDAYTKKTLLWGNFCPPPKSRVTPERVCSQGSFLMKLGGKSDRTKTIRSTTPLGFAKAFFEANP